jgi:nucleotide-binding universal stress UspA family protein
MPLVMEGQEMIKVIAWATDGSASARRALSVAKDLARAHNARLLVLHVQGTGPTRKGFFNDVNPRLVAALDRVADQLREEGFQAELVVGKIADGDQHRRILELAKEADVDLIVVGNRGHGPLAGLVLGSVALRLLQAASLPVLLVPSAETTAG